MKLLLVCVAVLGALTSTKAATQDYTAAVVEFAVDSGSVAGNDTIDDNLNKYRQHILTASKQHVSIIVFPEYGLTNGPVDNPARFAIVIPQVKSEGQFTDHFLEILSDAAKEYGMYVAVNILEKDTTGGKTLYYNTDIVFDRKGVLVAKYRTTGTQQRGVTAGPAIQPDSVFDTDFGVRFGLAGSYDILANISASPRLAGITDIILITSRQSYLPFHHSLSSQYGFAVSNRVNVLAASLSNPHEGISGSGIYGAYGTVYSIFISGLPSYKELIGKIAANQKVVPISPFEVQSLGSARPDAVPDIKKFTVARKFSHNIYKFGEINLQASPISTELCHGSFCCKFEVNVTEGNEGTEYYKLVVYHGVDQVGVNKEKIKLCAIVACESADVSSCGSTNAPATTYFDGLSITYNDKPNPGLWSQPVLLNRDLYVLYNTTFKDELVNGTKKISLTSKEQSKVVVFGILAQSGAPSLSFSFLFMITFTSVLGVLFARP